MPKGTKVHRCVEKVKKSGKANPYAVCQASTKQSYATGKELGEEVRPGTMGLAKGTTGHSKPTKTMGPAPGFPEHKPKKKKAKPENSWTVYSNMAKAILDEGKEKQATIAADKALTAVDAHASSDPKSNRYQRSMSSVHNSPQNVRIRKEIVKKSRADRGRKKAWKWAQRNDWTEYQRLGKVLAERMSFSQTQLADVARAEKPLNPTPKPPKPPSLKGDAKKKSQELAAQASSSKDLEEGGRVDEIIGSLVGLGLKAAMAPVKLAAKVAGKTAKVAGKGVTAGVDAAGGALKSPEEKAELIKKKAEMENQNTQYKNAYVNKLMETRSAASRRRTTERKEDAERKKRDRTGKSMRAYGHGQKASKELATAKTHRAAASELESHARTNPGPNPTRRKDVTATAAQALRTSASRKETAGASQIKAGKQAAGNKRAVNRTLKRDETKGNLAKLSIRSHTEYRNIGKIFVEMCATCKGEGEQAAAAEPDQRKKQTAYNRARRAGEHQRHGRRGETPRQTQTRRHGKGGVPSAELKRSEQRALADREEPK